MSGNLKIVHITKNSKLKNAEIEKKLLELMIMDYKRIRK